MKIKHHVVYIFIFVASLLFLMNENPLVSIVVPVYNAEEAITATLESVVAQTYGKLEVIIVNDGSTDASEEKIKDFIIHYKDGKIQFYYYYQNNKGVSAARNLGLKNSSGEFIALLDSDDYWHKEKIEKQLHIFKIKKEVDLLSTNRNGEKFEKFLNVPFQKITRITPKMLLFKNFFITPTVIFKKEIIKTVGYFNEDLQYAEDYDFFIRCTKYFNCYLLNESLVITGDGKPSFGHSGLSSNLYEMEKGELKVVRNAYRLNLINFFEYSFFLAFSFSKFLRRWMVTKTR